MTMVRSLTEGDRADWDRMVAGTPGSGFMQSWDWSLFKELDGYRVLRKGVFEGNQWVGGAIAYAFPNPVAPCLMAIPDGPVLSWEAPGAAEQLEALIDAFRAEAAELNAVALRVEPRLTRLPEALSSLPRSPVDLVPNETLEIVLSNEEELLAAMKPKGRYNIRLSGRYGVDTQTSTDPADVHEFYEVFSQTAKRQNFNAEPKGFFINLAQALFPDRARFSFARYKGELLAAAVTVRFGEMATYLYGGHMESHPEVMANYALHWHILQEAARDGYRLYDLYGFIERGHPEHPYDKFSRFKEKFGGNSVKRIGSRDILFYDRMADLAVETLRYVESNK